MQFAPSMPRGWRDQSLARLRMRWSGRQPSAGLLAILLSLLLVPGVRAAPQLDTAKLDTFVQQMMEAYQVPGAAIAIVQDGQVVHTRAFGVRDTTTGEPVTTSTLFPVGSITKSFTSLGVMLLIQDGQVDLDQPLSTYVPEYRLSRPELTPQVTVRRLLSHTTGLAYDSSTITHQDMSEAELLDLVARIPVQNEPGTTFTYNNVNADVAGVLIQRVSGLPYAEFVRTRIFEPLGVRNADLDFARLGNVGNATSIHQLDVLQGMQPMPLYPIGVDLPAAGVIANAEDMARYVAFQLEGGRLLRPDLLAALHTAQVSMAGPWTTGQAAAEAAREQGLLPPEMLLHDPSYAFYWITADFADGQRMVWHDGGGAGFVANVTLLPDVHSGLVILTNADRAGDFTEVVRLHIAEALLHVDSPRDTQAIVQAQEQLLGQDLASREARLAAARALAPDPSMLEALAGDYQTTSGAGSVSVRVASDSQLVIAGDLPPLGRDAALVPYSADAFLVNSGDLKGSARVVFNQGRLLLLFGGQPPIPLAQR